MERLTTTRKLTDKNTRKGRVVYLAHEDEPRDTYQTFITGGVSDGKREFNLRNLFDDSNRLDKKCLGMVKAYMRRKSLLLQEENND